LFTRRLGRRHAALVLLVAGCLGWIGSATASPQNGGQPTVTLDLSPGDGQGLAASSAINVTGAGFGSSVSGFLVETAPQSNGTTATSQTLGMFTASSSGTFTATVTVTNTFTDSSNSITVDCRVTPCYVEAFSNSGQFHSAHTISFGEADYFHPLTPARISDSRLAGPSVGAYNTPWGPNVSRDVAVTGVGFVPAGANAVVLNVTATNTTAAGYLTIWPAGQTRPGVSNLNWAPGQTIPNAATVKVGTGGNVSVFNAVGNADVIVDVVGYYDLMAGDGFTSLTPARILDSRPPPNQVGLFGTPWSAGQTRNVTVTGVGGVPATADAVVLNVTVTRTTGAGYLTIWPASPTRPPVSNLNWAPGQTIPNAVTVRVGPSGEVSVFNAVGNADVIIDVVGFFASGTGQRFHPLSSPARIQDSRTAGPPVGPYSTPWGPGVSRDVQLTGVGGVPAGAGAVLLNITVTNTTGASYLSVSPAGTAPLVSSLNWAPGVTIPNSVTAKPSASGAVAVSNAVGNVDVITDATGWYS